MLTLTGISKRYGDTPALADVDLMLAPGEIRALVGENGAGKSTCIKILAGAVRPDCGTILIDGNAVELSDPRVSDARGLAFVHQELQQVPAFDALSSLYLGRKHPTRFGLVDRATMLRDVEAIVAELAPDLPLDVPVRRLTIGQRQQVEILRAMIRNARFVIMDEPTAALGAPETARLLTLVRQLQARGTAILYVSHRLDEVLQLANTVTVLVNGRVVLDRAAAGLSKQDLIVAMSKRAPHHAGSTLQPDVEQYRPLEATAKLGQTPLSMHHLLLKPGADPITASLKAGEITALYGLVGAGRSRLLRVLFGADKPVSGAIRLQGTELRPTPARMIDLGVAYVPEDRRLQGLAMRRSALEALTLPHLSRFRVRPAQVPLVNRHARLRFADMVRERLAIRMATPAMPALRLSGGNQQKLLFGRWLKRTPIVALLDEPTRGVDNSAKADVHREIRRLKADGAAILLASSDLEETLILADRVLVMVNGSVIASLTGPDLTSDKVLKYLFGDANAPAGLFSAPEHSVFASQSRQALSA